MGSGCDVPEQVFRPETPSSSHLEGRCLGVAREPEAPDLHPPLSQVEREHLSVTTHSPSRSTDVPGEHFPRSGWVLCQLQDQSDQD